MSRSAAVRKTCALMLAAFLAVFSASPAGAADRNPNDPYFSELWYLKHIGVPEAWNSSLGFEGIAVAIIDSGVDIDHPDLKDNIWRNMRETPGNGVDDDGNGYVDDVFGWDFVSNDNDPRPELGSEYSKLGANHGTINAGVVAAKGDNGKGVVGVTWQTSIMPLRVLDSNGGGDPLNVVRAVEYAVANGAKVINLSFTGSAQSDLLAIALRRAYDAGVFVVAAAGNAPEGEMAADLDREPLFPVCLDKGADENFIYGVTATDDADHKAVFANFGSECVDLSAPGTRMLAAQFYRPANKDFEMPYGGYYNGTSLAVPVISGTVALIMSLDRTLTPKQIMNILTESSVRIDSLNPGYFGKLGRGRVNVAAAVRSVVASNVTSGQPAEPETTASLLPAEGGRRTVVAAAGPGRKPEIRLFTPEGLFIRGFEAFPSAFRGGVSLAIGNFDGNAKQTIVAGAGPGGGPHVRIFNINTQAIGGFFAFDQAFRGGVSVAAGDIDGDGRDEIAVLSGPGMPTTMRIFDAQGRLLEAFRPFGDNYRSGGLVTASDTNADGRDELVITPLKPSAAAAGVFNSSGERLASAGWDGTALAGFPTVSGDQLSWPASAAGAQGSLPAVKVTSAGRTIQFFAFDQAFRGGVSIGVVE